MISAWQSSIAHPVWADWGTVAAYVFAAILSFQAAGLSALRRQPREMIFWRITGLLLLLSAVNEPLDLQTLITSIAREDANAHGWYAERREVQYAFVLALSVAGLLTGIVMLRLTIGGEPALKLAWAGLVSIGLFVFLRAGAIHHFDEVSTRVAQAFRWAWLAELTGILLVGLAAARFGKSR